MTTTAQIPQFTPDSSCLSSVWRDERNCIGGNETLSCPVLQLGPPEDQPSRGSNTRVECYPDPTRYPATVCPTSYTAVTTSESVTDGTTYRQLECCPTTYDFRYQSTSATNSAGFATTTVRCQAANPSFASSLTALEIPTITDPAYPSPTPVVTAFNKSTNVLVATPIVVKYAVTGGSTCAPDCRTPWTGGPWPLPTSEPNSQSTGSRNDSALGGMLPTVIALSVVLPVLAIACVTWFACVVYRHKQRNQRKTEASFVS